MFKVRIVGKNDEKEARLSEEELKGFVSKFVIDQAKRIGFAKTTVLQGKESFYWHLKYLPQGDDKDCQS
jgi:hypothetical protein